MKGLKQHWWSVCFYAALIAFTVYISLDTFVLTRSYNTNAVDLNTAMFAEELSGDSAAGSEADAASASGKQPVGATAGQESAASAVRFGRSRSDRRSGGSESALSGTDAAQPDRGEITYQDDNVTITLTTCERHSTTIYVADVTMTSARYLKTAFANNTYGRNVTATTSSIAQANNAILAINGDFYGAQESGYVIRNGIVYRDTPRGSDVLCVHADGTMAIVNDRAVTAAQLVESGVWQAFTFGPALVENGAVTVATGAEVSRSMASNPRTAMGVVDANHYLLVVSDGRTGESAGLTLYELAQFMQELGAVTAYNLDGGGSSTMVFDGQIVNNPTTTGRIQERSVSDIVYIGKEN